MYNVYDLFKIKTNYEEKKNAMTLNIETLELLIEHNLKFENCASTSLGKTFTNAELQIKESLLPILES